MGLGVNRLTLGGRKIGLAELKGVAQPRDRAAKGT